MPIRQRTIFQGSPLGKQITPIRRLSSYPYSGRLIVLDKDIGSRGSDIFQLSNLPAIEFPMMPAKGIELNRQADYEVQSGFVIPDGVHMYKGTQPLQIPISFSLSIHDEEYCQDGALSLLTITARLHALTLPIGKKDAFRNKVGPADVKKPDSTGKRLPAGDDTSVDAAADKVQVDSTKLPQVMPPPTCRLELLWTTDQGPGIVCTGYVKDVSITLRGPFLRGPDESFNLPSSADFAFTFMHHPGHRNLFAGSVNRSRQGVILDYGEEWHAASDFVRKRLYNTRDQAINKDSYQGFSED